ncbi:MAG: ABC transporter permease, partial [Flavobacteriales bacterium]|nr:ABC transporter permease [Flavobacteriales bacterium]
MNNTSLNKLALKKLKKDKLAFSSLIFIFCCVLIAVFATIISPDGSKNANEMHIELATNKPLTTIIFLEFPKQITEESSIIEKLIFGTPSKVSRIPISSFEKSEGGLTYLPFQSVMEKYYLGDYKIVEQTFWFGTDKYGRDLLSRIILGTRISLSVGFIAVIISLIIGISFGLIAGYFRGKTDDIIMWFVNVIWSIPTLLMVIA